MSTDASRPSPDADKRPETADSSRDGIREQIRDVIVLVVRKGVECILFLYDDKEKQPVVQPKLLPDQKEQGSVQKETPTDAASFRQAFFAWPQLFSDAERETIAIGDLEAICRSAAGAFKQIVPDASSEIKILDDRGELLVKDGERPHVIADLFAEPIGKLNLPRLEQLPTKEQLYAFLARAQDNGVKMSSIKLLPFLIEAIDKVTEREIDAHHDHKPGSLQPHEAMLDLDEYKELAKFIAQALESDASEREGRLIIHPHHRAHAQWDHRVREPMPDETLLPDPEGRTEEIILGALKWTLPRGIRLYDLFENKQYLWGRICSSDNQEQSLLDIIAEEKLSLLLTIDHPILKRIHDLKPYIQMMSVPQPTASMDDVDRGDEQLQVLINRMLLIMKPFAKKEYYQKPSAEWRKKPPEGKITHDECWFTYLAIRDSFRQAGSLQEVLDILLPGIDPQYLQCPEDATAAAKHREQYMTKRLMAWACEADLYFNAVGREDISLFLLRFFHALANEPQAKWQKEDLFNNLRLFALGLPQEQDEQKLKGKVVAPWKDLQSLTGVKVLIEPDRIHDAALLLEPMRKIDSELRTIIWSHLSKNYPRLLRSKGTVVYDTELPDPIPTGRNHHVVVRKIGPKFCVVTLDVT